MARKRVVSRTIKMAIVDIVTINCQLNEVEHVTVEVTGLSGKKLEAYCKNHVESDGIHRFSYIEDVVNRNETRYMYEDDFIQQALVLEKNVPTPTDSVDADGRTENKKVKGGKKK